jgi:hypothetical protein
MIVLICSNPSVLRADLHPPLNVRCARFNCWLQFACDHAVVMQDGNLRAVVARK